MSKARGISLRSRRSSRSLRLLPGSGRAAAGTVPEPDGDRGRGHRVVAGEAQRRQRQDATEQGGGEEGPLDGEGRNVDSALAEQGEVGGEHDEVQERRQIAQESVGCELE